MRKQSRKEKGNVLVIVTLSTCLIIVPLLLVLCQLGLYIIDKDRAQSAIEAATLLAAKDLSRIVIDDPNFGYLSLSNYPPVGRALRAPDGEPLPVIGINTLVGTIRQNTIIAHELGNDTMKRLVEADHDALDQSIKELNATIRMALSNKNSGKFKDIHGDSVKPLDDVTKFLQYHLPADMQIVSVDLTHGWLADEGGTTTAPVPQPAIYSRVNPEDQRDGKYKPFRNIPAFSRPFTFAGLGSSAALVTPTQFRDADAKHICSIVKLECTIKRDGNLKHLIPGSEALFSLLTCTACGQPYTMPDFGPRGILTLRFMGEPVSGLQSWSDFLKDNFHDNKITTYEATNGDYPLDVEARMRQFQPDIPPSTGRQFAEHFYYWLRNGHMHPRVDAVLAMVNEALKVSPQEIFTYEFANDGSISKRVIAKDPFPIGVTADAQTCTVCDTSVQNGISPVIVFRDNVARLGTRNGGKHCGEPLEGHPLNWCEIAEFGGDEMIAKGLGKGRLGTSLTLLDPSGSWPIDFTGNPNFSIFRKLDGKTLSLQPRRSFYSGGLALDIEIGGITPPPVMQDVQRMQRLKR